jgi:hypothetical protein
MIDFIRGNFLWILTIVLATGLFLYALHLPGSPKK